MSDELNEEWEHFGDNSKIDCSGFLDGASGEELPACAKDCWKVLIFPNYMDLNKAKALVKKVMPKQPGKVNSDVLVIYTQGTEERDRVLAKLSNAIGKTLPYRRGCKAFEEHFGKWKTWRF